MIVHHGLLLVQIGGGGSACLSLTVAKLGSHACGYAYEKQDGEQDVEQMALEGFANGSAFSFPIPYIYRCVFSMYALFVLAMIDECWLIH